VRCFKDTKWGTLLMIDYGRGMVKWCDWVSARITETDIRWDCTKNLGVDHYTFDRNTFELSQKREYNEDVNASNFVNWFRYEKTECQKPRDER
jgi:hypothetical protein